MTLLNILSSIILFLFCPHTIFFKCFKIDVILFALWLRVWNQEPNWLPLNPVLVVNHLEWCCCAVKYRVSPQSMLWCGFLGSAPPFLVQIPSYRSASLSSYFIKDLGVLNDFSLSPSENIFNSPSVLSNHFLGIQFYLDIFFPGHLKVLFHCLLMPIMRYC